MAIQQQYLLVTPNGVTLPSGAGYDEWKVGGDLALFPDLSFDQVTPGIYDPSSNRVIDPGEVFVGYNLSKWSNGVSAQYAIYQFTNKVAHRTYYELLEAIILWQYQGPTPGVIRELTLNTPNESMLGIMRVLSDWGPMPFLKQVLTSSQIYNKFPQLAFQRTG